MNDIVLLRVVSEMLITTIQQKGIISTAEDYSAYAIASDKITMTKLLFNSDVPVATMYNIKDIVDGKQYFVKPKNGSESKMLYNSVCSSKEEILRQIDEIERSFHQEAIIEDYLDGDEYTVACYKINGAIKTLPIEIGTKKAVKGNRGQILCDISRRAFNALKLQHYTRIDFKQGCDGGLYIIDINLMPTLGPSDKWAVCFESYGYTYVDSLNCIIDSAT